MNKKEFVLTKTKFVDGVSCRKHLWLQEHGFKKSNSLPTTKNMKDGIEVGKAATKLYKNLTVIPYNDNQHVMEEATKAAMDNGATVIAEAAFSVDSLFCRVDILEVHPDGLVINEVKAVTRIREDTKSKGEKRIGPVYVEYLFDAGFQYYVLKKAGYNVKQVKYIYINKNYIRGDGLDLQQLLIMDDVTDEIKRCNEIGLNNNRKTENTIEEYIYSLMDSIKNDEEPGDYMGKNCKNSSATCDMWDECSQCLPDSNVFDLVGNCDKDRLYHEGYMSFEDLQESGLLKDKQMNQVEVHLSGKTILNKKAILEFMNTLSYPLYFLDFETFQDAIPRYKGQKPYEQVPFQYSLDIIETPGSKLVHKEFLGEEGKDPRREIAESLVKEIPTDVCVTAYHKSFENLRLKEMAKMFPDLANNLIAIAESLKDFEEPFRKHHYLKKEMKGRSSIKCVLPALFPDDQFLNYKGLPGAQNGTEAMDTYLHLPNMDERQRKKERLYLLRYCGLDTFAMVKVYEELLRVTDSDNYDAVAASNKFYMEERIKKYKEEDESC